MTTTTKPTASQRVFDADLDNMNAQLQKWGAVVTHDDGFQSIDASKAPAQFLHAYAGLCQYGYANGLI